MKNPFVKKPNQIDIAMERLLTEMALFGPGTPEYDRNLESLERLHALRKKEGVSPDVLANVVGGLLEVLAIVSYEQKHIMVSKALGRFRRSKS